MLHNCSPHPGAAKKRHHEDVGNYGSLSQREAFPIQEASEQDIGRYLS